VVSSFVLLIANVLAGKTYSNPFISVWDITIRLMIFIVFTLLLSALKIELGRERELARTDYLTGAANARLFHDLLQMEIDRFQKVWTSIYPGIYRPI